MNVISLSNNLDAIHRTSNNIPENFNWKVYIAIIKNPSLYNVSLAYNHYIQHGQFNPNIYKLLWRTVYDIPNNFNEDSYKRYLEEKCKVYLTFKTNEDLYKFYHYTGHKLYPLNEQYCKTHFNIPDDFNETIYTKLYPDAQSDNINMIYNFYNTNKHKCPLDESYYKLLYNIPNNFNLDEYKELYNLKFKNNIELYKHYDSFGKKNIILNKDTNNTNKKHVKINDIPFILSSEFNKVDFNFETINANESNANESNANNQLPITYIITEEEHNIYNINKKNFDYNIFNKRYNLYLDELESTNLFNKKFYEYPLDDLYYRLFYNIPNDFKEHYISSFKTLYNLDNSKTNIDIYKYYNNILNNCYKYEKENLDKNEDKNEDYIYYNYIEQFIDKKFIFYDNIFLYSFINNKIKLETIYNFYISNQIFSQEKNKFIEYYNYLNIHNNYIHSDFLKKKYFLLKPFINEYFEQNQLKLVNEEYSDNLVPLYTTFYYNNEFNINTLFLNIYKWEPIFNIYTKKYYYDKLFKKIKTHTKCNNNIELVYLMFDNYTHNYVSLMKTLSVINNNYKITIYTTTSINECPIFKSYFNTISDSFRITIKLVNDNFTFNKFNEMLYSIDFWNQFTSNFIVIFNSLGILKKDILDSFIVKHNFIGFTYTNINFMNYNFTIRNKDKMIEILQSKTNNYNISIFDKPFNLDKTMECFAHLHYFYKINNPPFIQFLDNETNLVTIINNIQ